ncbi:MAG: glycosyltransferase family 9 protein, partial [Cyanobacteriota bacterium]
AGPILGCDQHLPLGDLCRQLRPDAARCPAKVRPWLQVAPARREALAAALPRRGAPRLGLAWHSEAAVLGPRKSMSLAELAAAVARPGLELVCPQYGPVEAELAALRQATGTEVRTLAGLDRRDDLEGMAALIESCDLVITISSATAHLSGALGRPTWLLQHQVPYWPWQLEGERSLWYGSVRLFRQRHGGNWREPLAELSEALTAWLEEPERHQAILGSR